MLLVTTDDASHTVVVRQLQQRVQMTHLSLRRCTWLLLLLLLYTALTVQLSVGGRGIHGHVTASGLQQTAIARRGKNTPEVSSASNSLTVSFTGSKNESTKKHPKDVVQPPSKGGTKWSSKSTTATRNTVKMKPQRKHTTTILTPRTTAAPKSLMERVERASDPGLYTQMRAKLKSLGSAVTDEQLQDAANKCGGKKPALRYVQTYGFVHRADHMCSGELLALVAVHSNAKNLGRRATIRRTWGSLRYIGRFRVEVAFFLGWPASGDADESGRSGAQLEALIEAESGRFGDIVQVNYTENYRNLTIKHLAVYEWLLRHCKSAQYLVKVDDDTFTDVAHLATFLSRGAPPGLYCSATSGAKPRRTRRGNNEKWVVSSAEFPDNVYPTYCEGFGYIIHTKYVADIYLCSLFKQFFWIDDVHVTGILASSMGVPATRFWKGHGYSTILPSLASEVIMDYMFLTAYHNEFFEGLWAKLWHAVLQYSLDVTL